MQVHTCNPRIWETKAGKSRDGASLGCTVTLSQSETRELHSCGTGQTQLMVRALDTQPQTKHMPLSIFSTTGAYLLKLPVFKANGSLVVVVVAHMGQ